MRKRDVAGLWGHRPMRPLERRLYEALSAYLARLSERAELRYRREQFELDQWCDDGGRKPLDMM